MMEIKTKPTICIRYSDAQITNYEGDMKSLSQLGSWVEKYALSEEKEKTKKTEDKKGSEWVKFVYANSMNDVDHHIMQTHKPGLVLFIDKDMPHYKFYDAIVSEIAAKSSHWLKCVILQVSKSMLTDGALRREVNPKKLPVFKYYKNNEVEQQKRRNAH